MVLANKLLLLCGTKGIVWEELRFITKRLLFSDSDFDAAKDYFPPELWYEFIHKISSRLLSYKCFEKPNA